MPSGTGDLLGLNFFRALCSSQSLRGCCMGFTSVLLAVLSPISLLASLYFETLTGILLSFAYFSANLSTSCFLVSNLLFSSRVIFALEFSSSLSCFVSFQSFRSSFSKFREAGWFFFSSLQPLRHACILCLRNVAFACWSLVLFSCEGLTSAAALASESASWRYCSS